MNDFVKFIREKGVIGMAVGLAIGLQATQTVQVIVDGFIAPITAWILGIFLDNPQGLPSMTWTIFSGENPLVIYWGAILASLMALVAVALVIYFLIMQTGLNKLDKEKAE